MWLLRDVGNRGPEDLIARLADRIAALTPNVPQTDTIGLIREDHAR
jgi:hypothetical protein